MSRVYLLRHGLTVAPPGILFGRLDYGLSGAGCREIEARKQELSDVEWSGIFSSPLLRARESAAIMATGQVPVQIVPELAEVNLGLWEGQTKAWIQEHYPGDWVARGRDLVGYPPPRGESLADLAERVLPAFDNIVTLLGKDDNPVLIVAHQAVNRIILAHCRGLDLARFLDISQPSAALEVLDL